MMQNEDATTTMTTTTRSQLYVSPPTVERFAAVVVVAAFMSFVKMKSGRWPFTLADSLKNPLENKSGRCVHCIFDPMDHCGAGASLLHYDVTPQWMPTLKIETLEKVSSVDDERREVTGVQHGSLTLSLLQANRYMECRRS
jgi:hypothetical protein